MNKGFHNRRNGCRQRWILKVECLTGMETDKCPSRACLYNKLYIYALLKILARLFPSQKRGIKQYV